MMYNLGNGYAYIYKFFSFRIYEKTEDNFFFLEGKADDEIKQGYIIIDTYISRITYNIEIYLAILPSNFPSQLMIFCV